MPVYTKKSAIEEGLSSLANVAAGYLEGEREQRRRFETDRGYLFQREQFDETTRQFDSTFAEGIRTFDETFNQREDQFTRQLDQSQSQFDTEIDFRGEQNELNRSVDRYRIATTKKVADQDRAARLRMDESYLQNLKLLGDPTITKRGVASYTTKLTSGEIANVNIDELFAGLRDARKAGFSESAKEPGFSDKEFQTNTGIPHEWGGLTPNSARENGIAWDAPIDEAIALWERGDYDSAMAALSNGGIFTQGLDESRLSFVEAIGTATGGSVKDSQGRRYNNVSPTMQITGDQALEQKLRLLAAQTVYGDVSVFNNKSKAEQDAAIEQVWGAFQTIPQFEASVVAQTYELSLAQQNAKSSGYESDSALSHNFDTQYTAGQLDYTTGSGAPGLIIDNLPPLAAGQKQAIKNAISNMELLAQRNRQLLAYPTENAQDQIDDNILRIVENGTQIDGQLGTIVAEGSDAWKGTGRSLSDWYTMFGNGGQEVYAPTVKRTFSDAGVQAAAAGPSPAGPSPASGRRVKGTGKFPHVRESHETKQEFEKRVAFSEMDPDKFLETYYGSGSVSTSGEGQ